MLFSEEIKQERLRQHTTVFSQAFSPDNQLLVAGDNFGRLGLFSAAEAVVSSSDQTARQAKRVVQVCPGPIYSLLSAGDFLVCGSSSGIKAWKWKDLENACCLDDQSVLDEAWTLDVPSKYFDSGIINSLAISHNDEKIYSGGSNRHVHVWDVETLTCERALEGHKDEVFSVCSRPTVGQCVSGSGDGTVRLWDARAESACTHTLTPASTYPSSVGSGSVNWINTVSVDHGDSWLVCGGSVPLSLWHLRSLTAATSFPTPDECVHDAFFDGETIVSVGSSSVVHHWCLTGKERKSVASASSSSLFTLATAGRGEKQVISAAGNSSLIDIFTSFRFHGMSFRFA